MPSRVLCKTISCSNTILPDTAERNDGLCMPCVTALAREERERYIRENRKDVNAFEGVSDPVEILKIVHTPRKFDPLISWIPCPTPTDELYGLLEPDDQQRLISFACELLDTECADGAEDIMRCLSAFTDADLGVFLRRLVAKRCFWPSIAFRSAAIDVRYSLIQMVETDETNRNDVLCALAWIGDSVVVDLFRKWRDNVPKWSSSLHLAPFEYARVAGWELTADGRRRDLYFSKCFQLLNQPTADSTTFEVLSPRNDSCPWCSSQLTDFISTDLVKLGFAQSNGILVRVSVVTCEICTTFGHIYGVIDENYRGKWAAENQKPDYLPDDTDDWCKMPADSLAMGKERLAFAGADELLPTSFSQIGGHPAWVQDPEYPDCPSCSHTMMFLAQIAREDIEKYTEGIFYSFVCLDCKTTATSYQQT